MLALRIIITKYIIGTTNSFISFCSFWIHSAVSPIVTSTLYYQFSSATCLVFISFPSWLIDASVFHLGSFTYVGSIKGCHHNFVSWLQVHYRGLNVFWLYSVRAGQTSKKYLLQCIGAKDIAKIRGIHTVTYFFFLVPSSLILGKVPFPPGLSPLAFELIMSRYIILLVCNNISSQSDTEVLGVFLAFGCVCSRPSFPPVDGIPQEEAGSASAFCISL